MLILDLLLYFLKNKCIYLAKIWSLYKKKYTKSSMSFSAHSIII